MQDIESLAQGRSPGFQSTASGIALILNRGVARVQKMGNAIPPSSLIVLSSFAVQVGTAWAKTLFESLGSVGAAFVLKAIATLLLWCIWRPQIRRYSLREFGLLALLGGAIACMSVAFYGAIERIPMGVASTLEFTGPLGVAVFDSRRSLDLVWVGMAAMGVMLLSPTTGIIFDPIGIGFALLSAGCWAAYILLSRRAGRVFPGGQGLTLAMSAAALFLLPFGVAQAGTALLSPAVLWVGVGVAILGTLVPYSLEYAALKRVPPRIFGILMSVEPAIAALVGFLFLHEALSLRSLLAVVLVTSAAIGVTVFGRGSQRH